MSDFDFQPYRDFVLRHHEQQQTFYTPTDVLLPLQVETLEKWDQQVEKEQEAPPKHQEEQLPVLEGLRKYALGDKREHVILAGKPGSGKSTALQQLRLALAAEGLVPILVQLKGDRSVPAMIQGEFRRAKQKVSLEQIDDLLLAGSEASLKENQLVLLLDGVNEMPTDDLRRGLVDFREHNTTVPMIFTTRDLAVGGDLGIKQRLEMKPLTELQMRKFVGQRLPIDGEKLLGQLGDRLREIAETPLLLKMLCDVFGQTGQIPENKGELFRLFDREYEEFKGLPAVSADFRRFKSEILQHLAFVMMTGESSKPTEFWLTIDRGLAEREIEKILIDRVSDPATKAKEWLEDLLEHYLLQVAADARQVEFHHQLFQEYYAAEKLLRMFQNGQDSQDGHSDVIEDKRFQHFYLNYLKWTETLVLLLGLLDNEAQVIRIVKLGLEVDWMLGAKLSGAAKQEFHCETVALLKKLKARQQLKFELIKSNRKTEVPDWLKVELFKKTRSDEAIAELLEISRSSSKYLYYVTRNASYDAMQALGEIGSDAAVNALCYIIQHPELYPYLSYDAFSQLAKIGEPAKNALIQISHCCEPDVCEKAAEILKNQEDESRRKAFMNDLHEKYGFFDTESQEIDVDVDPNDDYVDPNIDISHLLDEIEHCHSRRFVRGNDQNLDKIKSYKFIPDLLKALESRSSSIHREIAEILHSIALRSTKPEETIPALLQLLKSENLNARLTASGALGWLKCREAVPALLKEFKNGDHLIRFDLADAFGNIGCTSAIPALLEALKDEDIDVRISLRSRIMNALGDIGSEEVIPALQKAFQEKDLRMRICAVYGFRNQKLNIAIPILRKAIKDEYDGVRSAAANVLGEIVHKIPLIKDEENATDKELELDCQKAACILLEAIEDGHYQVMLQAEKALEKFEKDRAAHIMPDLLTLMPTFFGKTAFIALTTIQGKCEFYNYDIFCSPPEQTHSSQQFHLAQTIINAKNAKEVKIFENVEKYYGSPPNSP